MEKEGQTKSHYLVFFHNIYLPILKMYTNLKDCGSNRRREICDKKLIGEKENMDK